MTDGEFREVCLKHFAMKTRDGEIYYLCSETGTKLTKETVHFHHAWAKGSFGKNHPFRHDVRNIIVLGLKPHDKVHSSFASTMKIWPVQQEIIEMLKQEHYAKI